MSFAIRKWKLSRVPRISMKEEHRHVGTREEKAGKDEQRNVSHSHLVTRSGVRRRWKGDRWIKKTEMFNPSINDKVNDNHADIIFNLSKSVMRSQVRTEKEEWRRVFTQVELL